MKIVIVNPNSTAAMTAKCGLAGQRVAGSGTKIVAVNPADSPASIQGYYDVALSTVPMLEEMARHADADAFVIACFDDTGLNAARCTTDKPVIGIGEAAFHMAAMISFRFSVVTTLRRSVPGIEDNLRNYGLAARCVKVRASDIPVLELERKSPDMMTRLHNEIQAAVEQDGAEAIVLGCAGMVELMDELSATYGLPVVDGVTSAVCLAEALVKSGLKTSKIGGYRK